jgi:hypothetical protein
MAAYTLATDDAATLWPAAIDSQHTLALHLGTHDPATGHDGIVVRPDLRFVIVYASTATHMLESRADGRGNYWHRINRDTYASAADIPATLRKLGAIARAVETADALTRDALATRYAADLALIAANEYRDADTRADALARLNAPNPFTLA